MRGEPARDWDPNTYPRTGTIPYRLSEASRSRSRRVPLPGRAGSISFGFAQERRLDLIKEIEPETFGCLFLAQNRLHPPSRRVSPIEYWICTVEYCLDL